MFELQPELSNLLLVIEFSTAVTAVFYFFRIKETAWKWFATYLFFITGQDIFWFYNIYFSAIVKQNYYAYFGLPVQFVFLYWLYALKSLKNKNLFWTCVVIYILSFLPIELYFNKLKVVYSFNYVVGAFLLMLLVFFEFKKQILNDDILEFKKNKMFYINIGVMLLYVGTLPFFGLYNLITKEPGIWNIYYIYFLVSNCIMYLLFSASFIWTKPK